MATIGTFTLKFNTDVSMAGTLRAAVEQIKRDVETIAQGVGNSQGDINQKHLDIVQKHGEVEAGRQEVASTKASIDSIQANINQQQSDIAGKHNAVTLSQNDINQKHGEVLSSQEDVASKAGIARSEADRSKAEADKSTANNNAVQAAKSEVEQAKKDVTAIAYGGEFSQAPNPGSVAVADSNGHLDIGWTPLLAAMYPYSGVIGSVDKGDLLQFWEHTNYSNKFKLYTENKFNIAGRLVSAYAKGDPVGHMVELAEAESTAARAIAFDDIFLDWNGTVTTYRSITPHRTTTGYDRDKIATEHGYTKVQTGLYKTGDTYALLLGRVARRNQGAYHPVFNPEGTCYLLDNTETSASWRHWYQSNSYQPLSTAECFTKKSNNGSVDGKIGNNSGGAGSSDNKFYDAIYSDDFTPLYYSAKNVIDRQALLFDSFNRAVAGETFNGAEGTGNSTFVVNNAYTASGGGVSFLNNTGLSQGQHFGLSGTGSSVSLYFHRLDKTITTTYGVYSNGPTSGFSIGALGDTSDILSGDLVTITSNYPLLRTFFTGINQQPSARPQFLMVDIIGAPEAWPEEWKKHGLPGNLLAVREEGESLVPDGTPKNYKLSRKCLECYQVLLWRNTSKNWEDITSAWKADFESASNSKVASPNPEDVIMVFYRTSANPFELADSGIVNSLANSVYGNNSNSILFGNILWTNLVGKIPTSNYQGHGGVYRNLNAHYFYNKKIGNYLPAAPAVNESVITNTDTTSIAVKALPYLSGSYLQIIYKEMKHNGTSWGDNNKFDIVDKQSTVTDLNGESVIVGQKRVELPYQFDGVQF